MSFRPRTAAFSFGEYEVPPFAVARNALLIYHLYILSKLYRVPFIHKIMVNVLSIKALRPKFPSLCRNLSDHKSEAKVNFANGDCFRIKGLGDRNTSQATYVEIDSSAVRNDWADFISAVRTGVKFLVTAPSWCVEVELVEDAKTKASAYLEIYLQNLTMPEGDGDTRSDRPLRQRKARSSSSLDGLSKSISKTFGIPASSLLYMRGNGKVVRDTANCTVEKLRLSWQDAD